jgi:hypothetical protein
MRTPISTVVLAFLLTFVLHGVAEAQDPAPRASLLLEEAAQAPGPRGTMTRGGVPDLRLVSTAACDPCCRDRLHGMAALYGWVTAIDGSAFVDGEEAEVSLTMRDVLENLEGFFFGYVEVQKGRWFAALDAARAELSFDDSLSPGPGPGIPIELEIEQTILEARVGYRVLGADFSTLACDPSVTCRCKTALDVFAGVRYWDVEQELRVQLPNVTLGVEEQVDWVDPLVGARFLWYASPRFALSLRVDVGGFGLWGDASDFSWQASAIAIWRFARNWGLELGYRALDVDRVSGSGGSRNGFDLTMHGPVLGVSFHW